MVKTLRTTNDAAAAKLAVMFRDNFKQFEAQVPDGVKNAGPG
jgi:hypothetical protein